MQRPMSTRFHICSDRQLRCAVIFYIKDPAQIHSQGCLPTVFNGWSPCSRDPGCRSLHCDYELRKWFPASIIPTSLRLDCSTA